MTGGRVVYALMLLLAMTLPLSALLRRRVAAGSALRLGLIWLAIIAGLLLAVKLLGLDYERIRSIPPPRGPVSFT